MAKTAPIAVLGQRVDHREQMADVGRNAVGDAHAQLDQRRRGEQAFLDHLLDEPQIAGVEHLELRLDLEIRAIAAPWRR